MSVFPHSTLLYICRRVSSLAVNRSFATSCTVAHQAPLSMGFSRQEYWSGLPFPSRGDLPDPGIESVSPALQADDLPTERPGKPQHFFSQTPKIIPGQSSASWHRSKCNRGKVHAEGDGDKKQSCQTYSTKGHKINVLGSKDHKFPITAIPLSL